MKILKIKIENPEGEILKIQKFSLKNINYLEGDLQDPKEINMYTNQFGEMILLRFVDGVFGALEDKNLIKKSLYNYKLEAIVLHNNEKYNITRIIGEKKEIFIDGIIYNFTEYRNYFNINRNFYRRQIIILPKKRENIGEKRYFFKDEMIYFLEMLGFDELIYEAKYIFNYQKKFLNKLNYKNEIINEKINIINNKIIKYNYLLEKYNLFFKRALIKIYKKKINENINLFSLIIKEDENGFKYLSFDFNLKKETKELNEILKILMDLLVFNYNNKMEILILSASSFKGIKKEKIIEILEIIEKISEKRKKQIIIGK